MSFEAKTLADSLSPDGVRLTTMEITFPRIILAEFNTHRVFSRNSASSRAIPIAKMLKRVREDPFVPETFPSNGKGMAEGVPLDATVAVGSRADWLKGRDEAVAVAERLYENGVHKGYTNRLLEPWLWHTAIVTATEWDNFFNLRAHPEAHGEMQTLAALMKETYAASTPRKLNYGEWHLPLVDDVDGEALVRLWHDRGSLEDTSDEAPPDVLAKISVGRCARVSYLTHDGKRDLNADIALHDRLLTNGHMSPFEHVARPFNPSRDHKTSGVSYHRDFVERGFELSDGDKIGVVRWSFWFGNFRGWVQYRKLIANEHDMLGKATTNEGDL